MKKYSGILSILCIFLIFMIPFPLSGQNGVYNTFSGLYWCSNRSACIHEIGHKLDHEAGWVSESAGFSDSVKIFILSESKKNQPDPLLYKLFESPDFSISEIYAEIFRYSDGKQENMPEVFREFYDWKEAERLMESVK